MKLLRWRRGIRFRAGRREQGGKGRRLFRHQVAGHAGQVNVFEEQGLGQRTQGFLHSRRHFDDDDGVDAVFLQPGLGADLGRLQLDQLAQQA